MIIAALFLVIAATTVFAPGFLIPLLVVNALVGAFLLLMQLLSVVLPGFKPHRRSQEQQPFFTILVPTYNEPPAILMQTLESLVHLDYEEYEVLVIDNNTPDPDVWRPIERYAAALGNKILFVHVDDLKGYKAGALNYGIERANAKSKYIAVVDADYVVDPDFLTVAASYFTSRDIALVQFPQAYRNVDAVSQPIADEYDHFFKTYMNLANYFDCVPSTGTLSVYSVDALRNINGFRGESITEDADAGLRIYAAGFRAVYVDRSVGAGFMPYDLGSYRKQKRRWALGNAQSIRSLFSFFGQLHVRAWIGFLSHFSAWHQYNLFSYAVLAGYVFIRTPLVRESGQHETLLILSLTLIFATLLTKLALMLRTLWGKERQIERTLKALAIHMGMTLLYSSAPFTALTKSSLGFDRTNKFILAGVPDVVNNIRGELLLGAWFALGAVVSIVFGGGYVLAATFLISSVSLFSAYYIFLSIRTTGAASQKLLRETERSYKEHLREKHDRSKTV